MDDLEKIKAVIEQTLAADFNAVKITKIKVHKDVDLDGDDVLRVDVVFEGAPKDLDVRKLSSVVRHIRPKLSEIGELAFPVLSFISNEEVGHAH